MVSARHENIEAEIYVFHLAENILFNCIFNELKPIIW